MGGGEERGEVPVEEEKIGGRKVKALGRWEGIEERRGLLWGSVWLASGILRIPETPKFNFNLLSFLSSSCFCFSRSFCFSRRKSTRSKTPRATVRYPS